MKLYSILKLFAYSNTNIKISIEDETEPRYIGPAINCPRDLEKELVLYHNGTDIVLVGE